MARFIPNAVVRERHDRVAGIDDFDARLGPEFLKGFARNVQGTFVLGHATPPLHDRSSAESGIPFVISVCRRSAISCHQERRPCKRIRVSPPAGG
jgi:hypothetical protein